MADATPPTSSSESVQRVHPGGFFWPVQRGDRLAHLVSLVAHTECLAVLANSVRDAQEYSERLTLSGVPVHLAIDPTTDAPAKAFLSDAASTLIATHEYLVAQGPVAASITVHLRTALSVRDYTKRIDAMPSAVHLSFVVPEDHKRANSLRSHFHFDQGHDNPADATIDQVIDLTTADQVAMVSNARRRFPLGR